MSFEKQHKISFSSYAGLNLDMFMYTVKTQQIITQATK